MVRWFVSSKYLFYCLQTLIFRCFKKFVEEVKEKERSLENVNKHGEAFLAEAKVDEFMFVYH